MLLVDREITRLWIGRCGPPRDRNHTDVLRGIATNMGMPFKTPEEFFLGQAAEPVTGLFDPVSYMKDDLEEPGMSLYLDCHSYSCGPVGN